VPPATGVARRAHTQPITREELSVRERDGSCSTSSLSRFMGEQQQQSVALIIMSNGKAGRGRRILKVSLAPQW